MAVIFEIIDRETIKPASSTPTHLKNFKLSLFDQITPAEYAPLLLFYFNLNVNAASISQSLKTSLSETLTRFYPFAGKIKDHVSIECTDDGVEYVEACANCLLLDILQQPDYKLFRESLMPIELDSPKAGIWPLLLVQATFFKCGGVAIGICSAHKLIDGTTISNFIRSWANISHDQSSGEAAALPEYVAASIFPPDDSSLPSMPPNEGMYRAKCVTKRFKFGTSMIASLKSKVSSMQVPNPTRVEALTALIWKCLTTVSRSNRWFPRLSLTVHAVNLRKMVVPPMPDNSVGNAVGYFSARASEKENIKDLVCNIRKAKEDFRENGLRIILETKRLAVIPELENLTERDDIDIYVFTSLSRLSLYDADFGWGNPIWVTATNSITKNLVVLMEAKDGEGIEALVSLSEEDMSLFERDPELLAFAAYNPSVLDEASGSLKCSCKL